MVHIYEFSGFTAQTKIITHTHNKKQTKTKSANAGFQKGVRCSEIGRGPQMGC